MMVALNPLRLALRNIAGSGFRSALVCVCAALLAAFVVLSGLVVWGAEQSIRRSLDRLGADILVVPWDATIEALPGARLMGMATEHSMPQADLGKLANVPGVVAVSPQSFLSILPKSEYCAGQDVFVVAFDPATDFALRPWFDGRHIGGLSAGQALAGSCVALPAGGHALDVNGYSLVLAGNLEPTGGDIDRTIFVSYATAADLVKAASAQGQGALSMTPGSMSAALVKVHVNSDPRRVAEQILDRVNGVVPVESTNLFQTERRQMIGLLRTVLGLLGVTAVLSIVTVGLVFSLVANERKREIAVLYALGSSRAFVLESLLVEGLILALGGGAVGIVLLNLAAWAGGGEAARMLQIPFAWPPPATVLLFAAGGLLLALLSVVAAVLLPVWRITRMEPALAMRD